MSRILCVVDSYNWALANRARALKNFYKNDKFDILHFNDLKDINFNNYNIVYILNWPIHGYIKNKISKNRKYRLVTTVSSHIGQPSDSSFLNLLLNYDAISYSNIKLYKNFKSKFKNLKHFYTPFGVDSDLFYPKTNPAKYSNIFGWVGNHKRPVKRYNDIKKVFDSISNVKLITITQSSNLSRSEMSDFYNKVGTVICFSTSEGTPNPILEAASCGRSIISTPVGNVEKLINGSKTIQIVNSTLDLKRAIIRNYKNSELLNKEGAFLRNKVDIFWNWKARAKDFNKFLRG